MSQPFRLTLVHPCIGRRPGQKYIKTWQMEPLPPALIAGLTPKDVEIAFYDDRSELIPYDRPTDLVGISIETYTAKRAYQIASEYRRRGVKVVMGGFHAGLVPDEVAKYAESVVVGEAENIWPQVVDDFRHGTEQERYVAPSRPSMSGFNPDRSIFKGKRYLPITLIEATRGCELNCEFCAIQTYFNRTQTRRPVDEIIAELKSIKKKSSFVFFVDDNLSSNPEEAKELMRALIPLEIRWVGQAALNAAQDEELLDLMARSGCHTVLIGFESLDQKNLEAMRKGVNIVDQGFDAAINAFSKHGIRIYATFVFGYDRDTLSSFEETVQFAQRHAFFIAAFNHLTPFPGTPLYQRLEQEGRLLYDAWWLDDDYSYNKIPFQPKLLSPVELQQNCVASRREYYSLRKILGRLRSPLNRNDFFTLKAFALINMMHRGDVNLRDFWPLGDAAWQGELLPAT